MYNFGQFRRSQYNNYLTDLSFELETMQKQSEMSAEVFFKDSIIKLSEDNELIQVDENGRQNSYYLKFLIYKQENLEQLITIKLRNEQKVKTLKTFKIAAGLTTDYVIFETIITPNDNYNQIDFELSRVVEDYNIINEDGSYGRIVSLEVKKLASIFNIINYLNPSIDNVGKLKQIGVQGPSGMLMSINGEEIRVGNSGIYEINYGVSISSLGFIIEENDNKIFLLDYQY